MNEGNLPLLGDLVPVKRDRIVVFATEGRSQLEACTYVSVRIDAPRRPLQPTMRVPIRFWCVGSTSSVLMSVTSPRQYPQRGWSLFFRGQTALDRNANVAYVLRSVVGSSRAARRWFSRRYPSISAGGEVPEGPRLRNLSLNQPEFFSRCGLSTELSKQLVLNFVLCSSQYLSQEDPS